MREINKVKDFKDLIKFLDLPTNIIEPFKQETRIYLMDKFNNYLSMENQKMIDQDYIKHKMCFTILDIHAMIFKK